MQHRHATNRHTYFGVQKFGCESGGEARIYLLQRAKYAGGQGGFSVGQRWSDGKPCYVGGAFKRENHSL